jgi:hypothetical protein
MPTDLTPFGSTVDGESLEAAQVFTSWLERGGDPLLLRPFVTAWLRAHGESREALPVFKAWLEADGKTKYVWRPLRSWLGVHATEADACGVFLAWLSAGGNIGSIKGAVGRWLGANPAHPTAAGLVSYLVRQKDLPEDTLRSILAWCQHGNFPAAIVLSRLVTLEEHLLREEVAGEVAGIARTWLEIVLNQESVSPKLSALVSLLFAILGESPRLRAEMAPLFLEWLRHPSSHPAPSSVSATVRRIYFSAQRLSTLFYLDELIAAGQLSVTGDRDALLRLFTWVKTWTPEMRSQVGPMLSRRLGDPGPG